jgi:hypothetical protein
MKKIDIIDTVIKLVLFAVAVVCIVMLILGGRLRDKKPAASMAQDTDTLPVIDCECCEDSVVEDGYGTFYYHPGQDPEWTTEK